MTWYLTDALKRWRRKRISEQCRAELVTVCWQKEREEGLRKKSLNDDIFHIFLVWSHLPCLYIENSFQNMLIVTLSCCFSYFCPWLLARDAKRESARPALQLSPVIFFFHLFFPSLSVRCEWQVFIWWLACVHDTRIDIGIQSAVGCDIWTDSTLKGCFPCGQLRSVGLNNDPMLLPVVWSRLFFSIGVNNCCVAVLRFPLSVTKDYFYPKNLLSQSSKKNLLHQSAKSRSETDICQSHKGADDGLKIASF